MSDRAQLPAESIASLPPILRNEYERAALGRGPWYATMGPAFLGLFVWAPFFDVLWMSDLARFSLPWLVMRAVAASVLCFAFYCLPPALWGWRTGRPLGIVAASTFGAVGSEWITGILVAVASIVWYAVALDFGIESTLLGLRACGLMHADALHRWSVGPFTIKSPVYLLTALFWIYITGTSSLWKITGVVSALMKVYSPIALLLLTAIAAAMLPELGGFHREDARQYAELAAAGSGGGGSSYASVIQLVTGFFAMSGLASVDWGARVRSRRDTVLGGLIGIVAAGSWTAVMALAIVAGTVAKLSRAGVAVGDSKGIELVQLSFRWGVAHGIGGIPAGIILILFGLAALAPACYSAWAFGQKLSIHWPRLGRAGWTWLGGTLALGIGAASHPMRLDWIYSTMGDIFAPAAGAIAANFLMLRGQWSGMQRGVNQVGVVAWATGVGAAVGLEVWKRFEPRALSWCESTSACGFVVAALVYSMFAGQFSKPPAMRPLSATTTDDDIASGRAQVDP